jgi:polyphosphate kinase
MDPMRHLPTLPSLLVAPGKPLIHRDVSWLQFNERVLDEARESSGNPPLERLKFLAITASNLDEFFMIRLASLTRKIKNSQRLQKDSEETTRLGNTRAEILEAVAKFGAKQLEVFDLLQEDLSRVGIHVVRRCREHSITLELGRSIFEKSVLPQLSSPSSYEPAALASLPNLKLAVLFPGELWFQISRKVPTVYSTVDAETDETYFFFLDDLLEAFLGPSFGLKADACLIRITRDGDITFDLEEEDSASVPDIVLTQLGSREIGNPMRLQYRGKADDALLASLSAVLKLAPEQVVPAPVSLVLQGLWSVVRESPKEARGVLLQYPALPQVIPPSFGSGTEIFDKLRKQDYLLHHPYDAFDAYVEWVKTAAEDPEVLQIEQTIYRMDKSSPILEALKKAALTKRVRVLIELRARFDEINNLGLADELRRAGVEVAYGFGKLKLHAKVTLVTRQEAQGPMLYTHLSTGNYNATTARTYTDVAILTSHPGIGQDARLFFDAAFQGKVPTGFSHLLSAPTRMHRKLLSLIEGETQAARAGKRARIVAKVNALVDEAVVEALYRASRAGVEVKLIVRGACSLIPGVTGLSENIQVISVVDRFLEHSRIYFFESAGAMYLSSADWMPRNFFSRLEIAFPVLDPRLYQYIHEVLLPIYLRDSQKAKELTPQGTWKRRAPGRAVEKFRAQFAFVKMAETGYVGTPLEKSPEPRPEIPSPHQPDWTNRPTADTSFRRSEHEAQV